MALKDLFNFKAAQKVIADSKRDVAKPNAKVVKLDDRRQQNKGSKK